MNEQELFDTLKKHFQQIIYQYDLSSEKIDVYTNSLTPEEAIGITKRKDYPILTGSEIMLQAKYRNSSGQAFTNTPTVFKGCLSEIAALDISTDSYARSIFIATLNAVKNELGLTSNVIHCKNSGPELCASHIVQYIKERYNNPNILLVGFQPAMIETLAPLYQLRVLDLNPKNIGSKIQNVTIEHGIIAKNAAIDWADLILCTGSTLCNGSIVDYMNIKKNVLFFGTTICGSADALNLERICFADKVTDKDK